MLDERKEQAITLMMQGHKYTDIAEQVGVHRSTLYNWLEDTEFKTELDKRRQEIKTRGNNVILNKLSNCIDELLSIALHGESEKVRSDTAQYLVDRVLGKSTTKIEQTNKNNGDNNINTDVLDAELKEFDEE